MRGKHVTRSLSAFHHGELPADESRRVAEHLIACASCRSEYEEIALGARLAEHLTAPAAPDSLWDGIEQALDRADAEPAVLPFRRTPSPTRWTGLVAATIVIAAVAGLAAMILLREPAVGWRVETYQGSEDSDHHQGLLRIGESLVTDGETRARIEVADLGTVDIEPNSSIRLVETDETEHRLALDRGVMHAMILAPPRLFFVDTPSAIAVDYGCAYTLEVDDSGGSYLYVVAGWVALEARGRESLVPEGAVCSTKPGIGPGTPHFESASEEFRRALARYDFEGGAEESLATVLATARPRDGLSLWHLVRRVPPSERARVYRRLAELCPPPADVTLESVMQLDRAAMERWLDSIDPTDIEEEE